MALNWARFVIMCPAVLAAAYFYDYTAIPMAMAFVNGGFLLISGHTASRVSVA